jgi:hypothetical protein
LLIDLKKKQQNLADGSLGEGSGKKLGRESSLNLYDPRRIFMNGHIKTGLSVRELAKCALSLIMTLLL